MWLFSRDKFLHIYKVVFYREYQIGYVIAAQYDGNTPTGVISQNKVNGLFLSNPPGDIYRMYRTWVKMEILGGRGDIEGA